MRGTIPETVRTVCRAGQTNSSRTAGIRTLVNASLLELGTFSRHVRSSSQQQQCSMITSAQKKAPIHASRSFSTSISLQKGKKNKIREEAGETKQSVKTKIEKAGNSNDPAVMDALTLSSLNAEIGRIQEKLKKNLSELKPGGRFNPALIEALRVDVSKLQSNTSTNAKHIKDIESETHDSTSNIQKGKKSTTTSRQSSPTIPLSELAQVIPRSGKQVLVMLNEEAFTKPVSSAILASPYSLNPQPSPTNPLEITVPIPPPSAETRKQTLSQVDKFQERAEFDLREGRGAMQKSLRQSHLSKKLQPDDFHDAQKRMEKTVEEAKGEIKRLSDASRKALQQG